MYKIKYQKPTIKPIIGKLFSFESNSELIPKDIARNDFKSYCKLYARNITNIVARLRIKHPKFKISFIPSEGKLKIVDKFNNNYYVKVGQEYILFNDGAVDSSIGCNRWFKKHKRITSTVIRKLYLKKIKINFYDEE